LSHIGTQTDDPAFTIENKPEQTCLGALIRVSDEFGSEEDLTWVCQELDEQGPGDPFRIIGAEFKPGGLMVSDSSFFRMRGLPKLAT
jgi:hypothetical protein